MSKIVGTVLAVIVLLTLLAPLNTWADEDILINVDEGLFIFRNLNLTKDSTGYTLKGNIVNNTDKDWLRLEFYIYLYDNAGKVLEILRHLNFYDRIKSDATKTFSHFIGSRDTVVSRYEIKFDTGEYEAKYIFGMTKPKVSKDLLLEDAFIKISFDVSKKQIGFVILNKTAKPIKIDWNQVAYIDVLNKSHKVMHSGVKYVDMAKVQPPTIIPPTAKIEDMVFPIDNIHYDGGWKDIPIFPEGPKAKFFRGKMFSVFMPLEINGAVKHYLFTFSIELADLKREQAKQSRPADEKKEVAIMPLPSQVPDGSKVFTDPTTNMKFFFVKGGCYEMGDTFGGYYKEDEKPAHNVCVNDFYLGKYEVTQGQWLAVMGNNPSYFKNCGPDCPVEMVSWNDTQDFIKIFNGKTGKNYRLPTEAEWEYAARSGGKKDKYAGASNDDALGEYAWYYENSKAKTYPVGEKRSNGLGLYDMTGNVYEWCQDWYGDKYYGGSPKDNPQGPSRGQYRVFRGGSFIAIPQVVRVTNRGQNLPEFRYQAIGLRLAVSAP